MAFRCDITQCHEPQNANSRNAIRAVFVVRPSCVRNKLYSLLTRQQTTHAHVFFRNGVATQPLHRHAAFLLHYIEMS
jgi:hypothetical protein